MTGPKKVYANSDYGFVGWLGGTVNVSAGDVYDLGDPFVEAHPDMFTAKAPDSVEESAPKRRGRRPANG